jgi:UDP-N-acetylglucosamine 2-epimerase (hydrolysing)
MKRNIVFVTGTRADYGKLKPIIKATEGTGSFNAIIFATGMHTLERYGFTIDEIRANGHKKVYMYTNQVIEEGMDLILGNTIAGFSRFVRDVRPDLIVIHGDRLEALAGASVGALAGIPVAHIEGGEVSGTIDESIRHAVSKLSHIHLVANTDAADRVRQLGEEPERIHVIGSPEIDVMLSPQLPTIDQACARYEIPFRDYAIGIFHPVTTELEAMGTHAETYTQALLESGDNYILVYPNNDIGSSAILASIKKLAANKRFRVFPSIRFEYFLTLLRSARGPRLWRALHRSRQPSAWPGHGRLDILGPDGEDGDHVGDPQGPGNRPVPTELHQRYRPQPRGVPQSPAAWRSLDLAASKAVPAAVSGGTGPVISVCQEGG